MHARRVATYADVLAVPEPWVAELIAGELFTSPRPAPAHANAATVLHLGADVLLQTVGGDEAVALPPFEITPLDLGELWTGAPA